MTNILLHFLYTFENNICLYNYEYIHVKKKKKLKKLLIYTVIRKMVQYGFVLGVIQAYK